MIAFISDIHANLAALQAVYADIDAIGTVDRIICLGDVIGYGPQPVECLEAVAQRAKVILLGNHEHAVLHGAFGFNPPARRAVDWTREQFNSILPLTRRKALWTLLNGLPERHPLGEDVLLVHGSPRDPVMEYVLESDLWEGADEDKMSEIFAAFTRLCFVGHTHRPGVFTADRCFLPANDLPDGFDVSDDKYLINVGSVGQPRNRDPRACYCLFSGSAVYWRHIPYPIDSTAALIRAQAELDPRLADRLYRGE